MHLGPVRGWPCTSSKKPVTCFQKPAIFESWISQKQGVPIAIPGNRPDPPSDRPKPLKIGEKQAIFEKNPDFWLKTMVSG